MGNNIEGKVVIITGASSGIGEAVAKHLTALGAKVSLGARRKEKLDQIVQDIEQTGGSALAFITDVTKKEDLDALVKNTLDAFGRVDVIFNNAGLMPLSRLENLHYEEWEKMIDTNIKGVLYGIGAVLPVFKEQKSGHFINVSSVAGHRVGPGAAVYSATKFAVRAISEGLRQEVKPYNIRTTIISPGAIKTELPDTITDNKIKEVMQPVLDIAISPESIARAVAYVIEQPEEFDVNEIILRPTAQAT
jgi:NADP-dependent 3-hydroxy acid dehydrogenase YdfG